MAEAARRHGGAVEADSAAVLHLSDSPPAYRVTLTHRCRRDEAVVLSPVEHPVQGELVDTRICRLPAAGVEDVAGGGRAARR